MLGMMLVKALKGGVERGGRRGWKGVVARAWLMGCELGRGKWKSEGVGVVSGLFGGVGWLVRYQKD